MKSLHHFWQTGGGGAVSTGVSSDVVFQNIVSEKKRSKARRLLGGYLEATRRLLGGMLGRADATPSMARDDQGLRHCFGVRGWLMQKSQPLQWSRRSLQVCSASRWSEGGEKER